MEATDFKNVMVEKNSLTSYLKNFHPKMTSGQRWGSFNFMKKEAQAILDDLQFSGFFFFCKRSTGRRKFATSGFRTIED